ncbi:MAG: DUF4837 family protein [Bacteroidales bacterium]|nr:DUF4837 family protein [Candidatus Cacconaster equi]
MRKPGILKVFFAAAALMAVCSCTERDKKSELPAISGKAGEIAVVATKAQWEAEPGTSIRAVLAADFPYIPQREPLYRLFNVPHENFNKIFRVHRNIINVKIADTCKLGIKVLNDIWASPQTVMLVTAPDELSAAQFITENGEKICSVFRNAERNRVIANAKAYENKALGEAVAKIYGGSPYFPGNYSLKKQNGDFMWISYETSFTNQGIFIYRFPFTGEEQFTPEYLISVRDAVLKENVPATSEGSYMITNPNIVPGFRWVEFNGRKFAEVRSLWDTHNDFMGGPFISDAFISSDGKEVIVIEGFVYAPKYAKRDYLRQFEGIIYSWH